jgi:hypothetical protein
MNQELKSGCEVQPERLRDRLYRYWENIYGIMFAAFALATIVLMAISVGVSLSRDLDNDIQRVDGEGVRCYLYQKAMSCIPDDYNQE